MGLEDGWLRAPTEVGLLRTDPHQEAVDPQLIQDARQLLEGAARIFGDSKKTVEQMFRFLEALVRVTPFTDRALAYHGEIKPSPEQIFQYLYVVMGRASPGYSYGVWFSRNHGKWVLNFHRFPVIEKTEGSDEEVMNTEPNTMLDRNMVE